MVWRALCRLVICMTISPDTLPPFFIMSASCLALFRYWYRMDCRV